MAGTRSDFNTYVPHTIVPIVMDTEFDPPLCGIRSSAAGDLVVKDGSNTSRTIVAVLAGETIKAVIREVVTSGTSIASPTTNLIGFRH